MRRFRRVLITGSPGCGKTTLISRIVLTTRSKVRGFITREIRENGRRVGFDLIGLSGKNWQMAHVNSASKERVGRYGVNVSAIDSAVEHELITGTGSVYIIDEIGKMELLSEQFRHVIENLWQSSHTVIATIMERGNAVCDKLKSDPETALVHLTRCNRESALSDLRNLVDEIVVVNGK